MPEYIICYDITCPRRLGKIHRLLKQHALPLQYSVFLFNGTEGQLQHCLKRLTALMNEHRDDIRAYPLPQRGLRWVLGPSQLPTGITLGAISAPWQADTPLPDDGDDDDGE
ncbi:CRISPR-associated endonuclease Cas2 [Comamonas nitrativorans]|uniref:CRISPR-associated endoribonuclease Cas2 n=1 Tax=Comamonas nitrativorans TaxID=108437 RepID=A0ABV9GVD5_9BURK